MREHSPKKKKYLNKVQLKQTKYTPITVALSSDSKRTAQQRDQSLDNPFQTSKLLYISKDNKLWINTKSEKQKAILSNANHKSPKAFTDSRAVNYDVYLGKESKTG